MAFVWGNRSKAERSTLHPDLVRVLDRALDYGEIDMTIICGHRGEAAQNKAFSEGKSMLKYPQSKHNKMPSDAVDVAPIVDGGIPWNDECYWYKLHAYIMRAAKEENVQLHWGGFWHKPKDMPHYQRA